MFRRVVLLAIAIVMFVVGVHFYAHHVWNPVPTGTTIDRIVVEKSARNLSIFANSKKLKTYHVALGRNPIGPKREEGDMKTTDGIYTIDTRWNKAQTRTVLFVGNFVALFVILGVGVDLPEIVKLGIGQNIFDTQHRRHHGVVLIVVFVHPVAADEVQIRITGIQLLPNRGDMQRVVVIVNRIRFFLAHDRSVDNVAFLRQANLDQLAFRQLDQVFVLGFPKAVA